MSKTTDENVEIEKNDFIRIVIELWRLRNNIDSVKDNKFSNIRHSILTLFALFEREGISFVEPKNQVYDAGMSLEVIDIEENPGRITGSNIIKEIIEPIVLIHGQVIHQGKVILEKGTLEENTIQSVEGKNE
jgi:hypothetical protein